MSRAEWILGGLLVVLLIIVAAMGLLLWLQPDLPGTPAGVQQAALVGPTPAFAGRTALTASAAAQNMAKEWQPDAELFRAAATWFQGATIDDIRAGTTAWSFTYYSPGRGDTAVILVTDDEASLLSEQASDSSLSPRNVTGWKVDSTEAIRTLLDGGGTDFILREGITTLIMTLTTANESDRIEWFVSLFAEQSGNALTMRLDATSGEILEVIQAP